MPSCRSSPKARHVGFPARILFLTTRVLDIYITLYIVTDSLGSFHAYFGVTKRCPDRLARGLDPRGRHHCGPAKFIGKTPQQIVEGFKDPQSFPWYKVPEALRQRRFEELWQLAHRCGYKDAKQTVQLLTEARTTEPGGGGKQRLSRSQQRALRSGLPAVPAYGNSPRSVAEAE